MKWEFKLLTPPWTGLLSTAGGLVFGGTEEGNFFALDADTGQPLWDLQLGAAVKANPVSFASTAGSTSPLRPAIRFSYSGCEAALQHTDQPTILPSRTFLFRYRMCISNIGMRSR